MKWIVSIIATAALVAAGAWAFQQFGDDTKEAAGVITRAPSEAELAVIESDLHNLRINLLTLGVDAGGEVPSLTVRGEDYVFSTTNAGEYPQGAGFAATAAGVTGTSLEDFCIWVTSSEGVTMHMDEASGAVPGSCELAD